MHLKSLNASALKVIFGLAAHSLQIAVHLQYTAVL